MAFSLFGGHQEKYPSNSGGTLSFGQQQPHLQEKTNAPQPNNQNEQKWLKMASGVVQQMSKQSQQMAVWIEYQGTSCIPVFASMGCLVEPLPIEHKLIKKWKRRQEVDHGITNSVEGDKMVEVDDIEQAALSLKITQSSWPNPPAVNKPAQFQSTRPVYVCQAHSKDKAKSGLSLTPGYMLDALPQVLTDFHILVIYDTSNPVYKDNRWPHWTYFKVSPQTGLLEKGSS